MSEKGVFNSVADLVGGTPLVRINKLTVGPARVLAKLECFNPLSSVKDRAARSMIVAAEQAGSLVPGGEIIEPTSGNTGIALAFLGAARGYKVTLVMPESMSMERRMILKALGASLVLTPAAEGMNGSIARARDLVAERENAIMLDQFNNPANSQAHYATTAEEIWHDTAGTVDVLVCGVGTGGTITGTSRRLRELNPDLMVVAVEPAGSQILGGGTAGPHKIQGIGAGFIPGILDVDLIDEVIPVSDEQAWEMTRRCAREEGLLVGISSGAALEAAMSLSGRSELADKTIVVVLPDGGERYLSTDVFKDGNN
jgi:cysteine synthase